MEYKEVIDLLERASYGSKVVRSFYYADVSIIDRDNNVKYPAVVFTAGQGRFGDSRLDTFTGTLTYIDRLTETRRKREIHSVANAVLKDIVNRFRSYNYELDEDGGIYEVTANTINFYSGEQNFADANTGAWVNLEIEVDNMTGECFYTDSEECEDEDNQ